MLVDRENGRAASVVYESRAAMNRATEAARPLRDEFNRLTGWKFTEIAEFDLALAHLRVPGLTVRPVHAGTLPACTI